MRRLVADRDWAAALESVEFLPLKQAPEPIILSGPHHALEPDGVLLYVVLDELREATRHPDWDTWYRAQRDLFTSGMKTFWFALACLGDGAWLQPSDAWDAEAVAMSRVWLADFLPWWPTFCDLEHRFSREWSLWGTHLLTLVGFGGMPDFVKLAEMSPREAGRAAEAWLLEQTPSSQPRSL